VAAASVVLRRVGLALLGLLLAASAVWGALALYFFDLRSEALRIGLAATFAAAALVALAGLAVRRWRWRAAGAYLVLFAIVLWRWAAIEPSNDRDWQTDVAVLPYATIAGDLVTVHRIRNFDYRSETDYAPRYYDKTFDLRQLVSVELVASYWMGPDIAHTFLSFGFAGGDHLAVSIETRKEAHESYSTIRGFFRQYELYYVVADERDVVRVRTNYRRDPPEDVYVYPIRGAAENGRNVFMAYVEKINALKERAEFYNTLTTNCTTNIWMHSRVNPGHLAFSWKILASGRLPEYLYDAGRLDTRVPFVELQRRSHVNARAQAADQADDFSRRIRALPPGAPR
jgi:hypothetical protein